MKTLTASPPSGSWGALRSRPRPLRPIDSPRVQTWGRSLLGAGVGPDVFYAISAPTLSLLAVYSPHFPLHRVSVAYS